MFDELIIKRNKDNTYSMTVEGYKSEQTKQRKIQVQVPVMRNIELNFSEDREYEEFSLRSFPRVLRSYNISFDLNSKVGFNKRGIAVSFNTKRVRPTKIKRIR